MRSKIFCDGKEEYPLCSFETKEQAKAFIEKERKNAAFALYPSLRADIGLISRSPVWGSEILPEALRAVSYYLGICCGWPMESAMVECENGDVISLSLARDPLADISLKAKICKQMFENITVSLPFAAHSAVRLLPPFPFVLVDSKCVDAVDLSVAEALCTQDKKQLDIPICFASLREKKLCLRACMRGHGPIRTDDAMYMRALAYFFFVGRAERSVVYEAEGGLYCIPNGSTAESARKLSPILS